jgi:putative MFS transporter
MLLGSVLFGILSDRLGRRIIYLASLFIVVILGLLSSFAQSIQAFALLRFVLGFGYGGNGNTCTNLMVELMPSGKRGVGATIHGFNWGLGSLVIASIAWIGGQNLDWRWLVRVPSFIAIPVLVAVFWLPESPRFYVHVDNNEKIISSLRAIAAQNNTPVPAEANLVELNRAKERTERYRRRLALEDESFMAQMCGSVVRLFTSKRLMFLLLPLAFVWLMQGVGATVITWLPRHSLTFSSTSNGGKTSTDQTSVYITAFVSAAGVVVAAVFGLLWLLRSKRQHVLRAGLFVTVAFTFGVAFAPNLAAFYAFTFFICAACQLSSNSLYLYTPEILPTHVRSTGLGFCLALYRIGSLFAPFIAAVLTDTHSFTVTSAAFATFFVAGLLASFALNVNTVDVPLKERASKLND